MERVSGQVNNDNSSTFEMVLRKAAEVPLVNIDRATFLRKELKQYCSDEQIETAVEYSPAHAGISSKTIDGIAKKHITLETTKVSGLSFVSGLPGGIATLATVPADTIQYFGHILRIAQKIAYLYGWQDFSQFDEFTESLLTLFVGIMFGVEGAAKAVAKVSNAIAASAAKKIAAQSLTKGTIYPIVKRVAALLGLRLTKQTFANGVSKAIPVFGGVLSGGLTLVTYRPMAVKLQKEMKTFKQARADFFTGKFEEEDIEISVDDIHLTDVGLDEIVTSEDVTETYFAGKSSNSGVDETNVIEQRLVKIEKLKNRGLITKEEYAEKRKQIIEDI